MSERSFEMSVHRIISSFPPACGRMERGIRSKESHLNGASDSLSDAGA